MKIRTLLSLVIAAASPYLYADVLVSWENDHLAGNEASTTAGEALSAGSWHADLVSAPVLSRGLGGTGTQYTNTFGMRSADAGSLANAIESNRYVTFTLSAQSGKEMNLTNLFARLQAQNATAYEVYFTLMSDATGFDDGSEITTWVVGGTGESSGWLGQERTVDLSGITEFQGLTDVEFRIYIHGQVGEFTQVGIGRAFQVNGSSDLRLEGEIVDGGGPGPDVAFESFVVNVNQAEMTWSAAPEGSLAAIWWMPDLDADVVDQVVLATDIPHTQTSYTDADQHNEERGFYRIEWTPAP